MAVPYNNCISIEAFQQSLKENQSFSSQPTIVEGTQEKLKEIAVKEFFLQTFIQPLSRGVQFLRDAARLVLKVPIRSIWTPIILPKNWKQRERAKINTKLTGYAFIQLIAIPAKILISLTAIVTEIVFWKTATQWLLNKSRYYTAYLDGRTSQLEALKEEGVKKSLNKKEYNNYKNWLYNFDPLMCRPAVSE